MKMLKAIVFMLLLFAMMYVVQEQVKMIVPVNHRLNPTLVKLQTIGINSEEIARSVDLASLQSGLSQNFLIALMFTESAGNPKAVSSLGYNGLMQIPWPIFYSDANMITGAHIFNEKMILAGKDLEKAIILYKGYKVGSERGLQQVRKVLRLCKRLSEVKV